MRGAIIIEGHIQGLSNARSLGEAGIQVMVVDTGNCVARYSRYCRKFYKCPPYDSDELANFLSDLAIADGLTKWLLLPSNDHAVLTLSRNKKQLEKYFIMATPDPEILQCIYDKSKLLEVAVQVGVPIPSTFYAHGIDLTNFDLSYPVLTKGRQGLDFYRTFGRKAFLAENSKQLKAQLAYIDKIYSVSRTFVQEVIPNDGTNKTISFCAFCVRGEIKTFWMGEKLREHPIQFGTATFARSMHAEACYRQSIPLLKALQYTGVCEVEYLRDLNDGEYKLIEINPRTWLWVELAKACGVNFAMILYDYMNENQVSYPVGYEVGRYWINPLTDTVYSFLGILRGNLRFKQYMRSIGKKNKVNALFQKGDFKPFLAYFLSMLSFLRHR